MSHVWMHGQGCRGLFAKCKSDMYFMCMHTSKGVGNFEMYYWVQKIGRSSTGTANLLESYSFSDYKLLEHTTYHVNAYIVVSYLKYTKFSLNIQ